MKSEGEEKPYTTLDADYHNGWKGMLDEWDNITKCLKDVLSNAVSTTSIVVLVHFVLV